MPIFLRSGRCSPENCPVNEKAKKEADAKGIKDWKSLCESQPPHLDPYLEKIISKAAANELTGLGLFDVSSLADATEKYQTYLGAQK